MGPVTPQISITATAIRNAVEEPVALVASEASLSNRILNAPLFLFLLLLLNAWSKSRAIAFCVVINYVY